MTTTTETKTCTNCGQTFPLTKENWETWYRKSDRAAVFVNQCRNCTRAKRKAWREKNKEAIAKRNKEYKEQTRERINANRRKRRLRRTPEEIQKEAERKRRAYEKAIQEQIKLWFETHTEPPKCKCGCGEAVSFSPKGPRDYVQFHQQRDSEVKQVLSMRTSSYWVENRVPIDKIRTLLQDYKNRHNMTWREVQERSGLSAQHFAALMWDYRPQVKGVSKKAATDLINRLSGRGATPTTYQRRELAHKEASVITQGGLYGLLVVRNEANRYLQACLEWHSEIFDNIFVLDDQSTDETYDLCRTYTEYVVRRPDDVPSFMEHEGEFRHFAWRSMAATFGLTDRDWVIAFDADEFFVADADAVSVREVIDQERFDLVVNNHWAMTVKKAEIFHQDDEGALYYRTDSYWGRDTQRRGARYREGLHARQKTMGSGSLPAWYMMEGVQPDNFRVTRGASGNIILLHVGYMDADDRISKYNRYKQMKDHGHNPTHIESIIKTPRLIKWQGQTPPVWKGMM